MTKPPHGIRTDHYTTAGIPAADRHDLWAGAAGRAGTARQLERGAARVARTLIDMLALSVRAAEGERDGDEGTQPVAERARGEIQRNLGSAGLNAASLCRRLDISRSTLHRLFGGEGGVQA